MRLILSFTLIFLVVTTVVGAPNSNSIYVSVGDDQILFGPDNDASIDSVDGIYNIISHWKNQYGVTDIFWRLPLFNKYNEKEPNWLNVQWGFPTIWPVVIQKRIIDKLDVTEAAVNAAKSLNVTLNGGIEVYSVGIPPEEPVQWPYVQSFYYDNPECLSIDRDGNIAWGIPEYGVPLAREHMLERIVTLTDKYDWSGIYLDLRSETYLLVSPPQHGDQYGFNPEVVTDFYAQYGVNILTDPRFDYKSPNYDINDPMVENWRQLRGSYLTQLLRDIHGALPDRKIAVCIRGGDYYGWPVGNMAVQWRTWIDERLIDTIIVNWTMGPPTINNNDTFLTNAYIGQGVYPVSTFVSYINEHNLSVTLYDSARFSGSPAWMYTSLNEREYLASEITQYRNNNLSKDGFLGFIKQNFDNLEPSFSGYVNKMDGDWRYSGKKNFSKGLWGQLSDGNDARPLVQNQVKHGNTGNAVRLLGVPISECTLRGQRKPQYGGLMPEYEFDKLSNKWVIVSFWVYRDNNYSGLVSFMRDKTDTNNFLMGFKIDSSTGRISCQKDTNWYLTNYYIGHNIWQKFLLICDLDRRVYTVYTGEGNPVMLAKDLQLPANPSTIDEIVFEATGNMSVGEEVHWGTMYIDDVEVQWWPDCGGLDFYYDLADINKDCYVDFSDMVEMMEDWLKSTHPLK